MKFIKLILIIIIFNGSVYPCADEENILLKKSDILGPSLEHNNKSEDNCSLFCYCTCCSVSYSIVNMLSHNATLISVNKVFIDQNYYLVALTYSIWQPPKIS